MAASIHIIPEKCVGCKLCVKACPFGAIDMAERKAVINEQCTLCGVCVPVCKFKAIDLQKDETAPQQDLSAWKGVWVYAEHHCGVVAGVTLELLGEGRRLAEKLGTELSAVLPGNQVADAAKQLITHGADNVYVIDHPILQNFNDES